MLANSFCFFLSFLIGAKGSWSGNLNCCGSSNFDVSFGYNGTFKCGGWGSTYGETAFQYNYFTTDVSSVNFSIGGWYASGYVYYAFAFKNDDYQTLATKIGVTANSVSDLLNNYSTQILNNESAIYYMIMQCTGDFMAQAIQNSTFMTAYANSPYKSLIDNNEHWAKFLAMIS